jgi:hypothetical protein
MSGLGNPGPGHVTPSSDADRIQNQIDRGEIRTGPDAAREIAQRIENEGGFWDRPGNPEGGRS